jgi:hypothetical protein
MLMDIVHASTQVKIYSLTSFSSVGNVLTHICLLNTLKYFNTCANFHMKGDYIPNMYLILPNTATGLSSGYYALNIVLPYSHKCIQINETDIK